MENKSFSGIIITYNEEGSISQCINSLNPFCSEILVVDSFSTDKTIELAKKLGAKVIQNEFNSPRCISKRIKPEIDDQDAVSDWRSIITS